MSKPFTYKGYTGTIAVDVEANIIHGEVVGLKDVITFQGATAVEAAQAFRDSVDDYLNYCQELGESPERPYNGKLSVRLSPEMHRRIDHAARAQHVSINSFVERTLKDRLASERFARGPGRVHKPKGSHPQPSRVGLIGGRKAKTAAKTPGPQSSAES